MQTHAATKIPLCLLVLFTLTMATVMGSPTNTSIVVDGEKYEDIEWGKVTLTTVAIRHRTGIATLPLAALPSDLQTVFHYDPVAVATAHAKQQAWEQQQHDEAARRAEEKLKFQQAALAKQHADEANQLLVTQFESERTHWFVVDNKLVERRQLLAYHWTVREALPSKTIVEIMEQIQVRRGGPSAQMGGVFIPAQYRWENTGEKAQLLNYSASLDSIGKTVEVLAREINPINGLRTFSAASELTFEKWQELRPVP